MDLEKLMMHISIIPDYRQPWKVTHKLSDILLLTICAVISGVEGWADIENSVQLVLKVPHRHEKGSYKVDSESESYLRSFSGAGLNFMRGYTFYDEQYKKYFKIITFDGFPTLKIHGENGAVIPVIDENTQRYSTLGGFNLKATVNAVQWKNPEYGSKANPYPVFAHDVILIPPARASWAATIEGFKITDSLNFKFVREYLKYFISKKELISLELDKG